MSLLLFRMRRKSRRDENKRVMEKMEESLFYIGNEDD